MSKYKHAIEVIENWERVEMFHADLKKWGDYKYPSVDTYELGLLNDPKKFRIKREPRRVWVNIYPSELYPKELGMACVAHFSESDAKACIGGKPLESAVEFVEVLK